MVRLGRAGVRALWWWQLQRATAERLLLPDAVAELGPSLLVLYRHAAGDPARMLTRLKGGNDPAGRVPDSLRSAAGSPNRLLTLLHTSDDPADVARELAVFLPWRERATLVASASASGLSGPAMGTLGELLGAVNAAYVRRSDAKVHVPAGRGEAFAALARDVAIPDTAQRWSAVAQWSREVPLLNGRPVR